MEKKGVLIPTVLAIGAALLYILFLTSKEHALSQAYATTQVLVAKFDLPERTVLKADMVETESMPRKFIEQDAFEVRTPDDQKRIEDLVTRIRIPKGNQITESSLVSLSPEAGLSVKVPPGYRGAIVPISSELETLIKPGDHVDIMVTFEALMQDGRKEKVTATILQNVLVIAVGTNMGQGMNAPKGQSGGVAAGISEKSTIAVALNPNEAQYLDLSMKTGDIAVILRGLGDMEMHPMEMANFRKLFK
jgi:pilus assembly protein CpaB